MKAYLAIKFKEDHSNRQLVEDISDTLKELNVETYVMARDFEKWGEARSVEPDVLMAYTFKVIDESDFIVIEFSEKGVGLGIEVGYAFAKRKPVVIVAKEGSDVSSTLQGVAKSIIFYRDVSEINQKLQEHLLGRKGASFIALRPDGKVLMQLRDGNSKRYKHMWCFPGGACDSGEEYIDTVIREAKEEYELTLQKEHCVFLMSRVAGTQHIYICKIDGNQEPKMHEGADMKWMDIEEIKQLVIAYNQADIVAKLEEYLKNRF
jgi:8-oxo-dGTP pyrophosphatase MutT (NUDIX family)